MAKLDRRTRYWPLVYSKSIIFNLAKTVDPLLEAIVKVLLTFIDCDVFFNSS